MRPASATREISYANNVTKGSAFNCVKQPLPGTKYFLNKDKTL